MPLGERLRRLDDSVVPNAGWTWNLPSTPRWVRWFGYGGMVVGLLAIIFLDQPWSTVIVTIDLVFYFGLIAYYKRRAPAVFPDAPPTP